MELSHNYKNIKPAKKSTPFRCRFLNELAGMDVSPFWNSPMAFLYTPQIPAEENWI